jgi:trigger factor
MKVVVNELAQCKRGLEVEVPTEAVAQEMERVYREYSHRAKVPGFRKGKIPMDIVRRRFAGEVREEVVGNMVREYAFKALEEHKLEPIQPPVLEKVSYESGQPLTFKATFEVRPQIRLESYRGVAVKVARQQVSDEMVSLSIKSLAERAAKLEAVSGRPAQKGDYAVGTLSCRFVKGSGKDLQDEQLFLEAGAEDNHPDFNAAILGLNAGDSRTFETTYPDDYNAEALRGCTVAYTVNVKEIKKKVVPPIDDDLAKELGNFQSLEELRSKVREQLERRASEAEQSEAKNRILAELVKRHPVEVPESLVEAQMDGRLQSIAREMASRGIDPTKADVNWKEEREKLRPASVDSVRAVLILEAIAAAEGIDVQEDDLNAWLREEAKRHDTTVADVKRKLSENTGLSGVRKHIVREKSLDFLLRDAIITHEVT